MFSANAVSTAIDFKTITIGYSISALVVTLVLLLYLFAALFRFVKNCLKVLQCIEINCAFALFLLKCCTMYIHMYISILCLDFSFCWQIFLMYLVFCIKTRFRLNQEHNRQNDISLKTRTNFRRWNYDETKATIQFSKFI